MRMSILRSPGCKTAVMRQLAEPVARQDLPRMADQHGDEFEFHRGQGNIGAVGVDDAASATVREFSGRTGIARAFGAQVLDQRNRRSDKLPAKDPVGRKNRQQQVSRAGKKASEVRAIPDRLTALSRRGDRQPAASTD